jgi:hypothetical protein
MLILIMIFYPSGVAGLYQQFTVWINARRRSAARQEPAKTTSK